MVIQKDIVVGTNRQEWQSMLIEVNDADRALVLARLDKVFELNQISCTILFVSIIMCCFERRLLMVHEICVISSSEGCLYLFMVYDPF